MQLRRTQPELPCFCGCQALRRWQRGSQVRSGTGGAWGSAAGVVWLVRPEQFLSPQLRRHFREMRKGHLRSWAPRGGWQGDLSLCTGNKNSFKKILKKEIKKEILFKSSCGVERNNETPSCSYLFSPIGPKTPSGMALMHSNGVFLKLFSSSD